MNRPAAFRTDPPRAAAPRAAGEPTREVSREISREVNRDAGRETVRETPAEAARERVPQGYLTSSVELRAGLEISALPIHLLPQELLSEFQRLRRCWDRQAA